LARNGVGGPRAEADLGAILGVALLGRSGSVAWDGMMATDSASGKVIRLTGPVTLYEVKAVRDLMRVALSEGLPLQIDLSESGPWDVGGLQLLVACVKTGTDLGQPVTLVGVPGVCVELARRSGLLDWLRSIEELA
jgi:ABC-type transporter Mla MlaB component